MWLVVNLFWKMGLLPAKYCLVYNGNSNTVLNCQIFKIKIREECVILSGMVLFINIKLWLSHIRQVLRSQGKLHVIRNKNQEQGGIVQSVQSEFERQGLPVSKVGESINSARRNVLVYWLHVWTRKSVALHTLDKDNEWIPFWLTFIISIGTRSPRESRHPENTEYFRTCGCQR